MNAHQRRKLRRAQERQQKKFEAALKINSVPVEFSAISEFNRIMMQELLSVFQIPSWLLKGKSND